MSLSSISSVNIAFYSLTIVNGTLQLIMSIYVLLMLISHRWNIRKHRIDTLLYANTYLSLIFISLFFLDMSAYSIHGHLYPSTSFQGRWCQIKGYLLYGSGCTFFHTFLLQAFYRLNRILFRTHIHLQSFRLYLFLSIILWPIIYLELIPSFLIGDIEYLPHDYHCQFSLASVRGSLTVCSIGFLLPFTLTLFCYIYTMYRVHQQSAALFTLNQHRSIRRDLFILKRLAILLTFVTLVAAPHALMPIVYALTGYLPGWITSLEWVLTSFALVCVSIVLVLVTSHLKKICTLH